MSSAALSLRAEKPLTPAMISALWEIAAILDEVRTPANVPNAVWLTIPTTRLRGPEARTDNVWLRECLERMTGLKLSGQHRGDEHQRADPEEGAQEREHDTDAEGLEAFALFHHRPAIEHRGDR